MEWCLRRHYEASNLVAKMLMRQFDMKPKEGANEADEIIVSRIYSTALLILLQHPVLQYFLLYIEQKLYGPLWVP